MSVAGIGSSLVLQLLGVIFYMFYPCICWWVADCCLLMIHGVS